MFDSPRSLSDLIRSVDPTYVLEEPPPVLAIGVDFFELDRSERSTKKIKTMSRRTKKFRDLKPEQQARVKDAKRDFPTRRQLAMIEVQIFPNDGNLRAKITGSKSVNWRDPGHVCRIAKMVTLEKFKRNVRDLKRQGKLGLGELELIRDVLSKASSGTLIGFGTVNTGHLGRHREPYMLAVLKPEPVMHMNLHIAGGRIDVRLNVTEHENPRAPILYARFRVPEVTGSQGAAA